MSPKIQEIGAQRFRHALANSSEDRASFCEPVMTYRDRTGWLGGQDSNLRMSVQPPLWVSRNFFLEMEADVISTRMMRRACVGGRTLKKAKKR